ncbi:MAG: DUF86 domain-containing protein [Spirochaetes bacterium]|nr:DUF86 domain-containing protein [Spirochaetota bacterium]
MRADDRVRVLHMIDAAESLEQFTTGRERADLESDRMLLFAIIRAIEVMGEAASKITKETKDGAPDIPWIAIVGMRNRLIHGYFDVDSDVVWKTVTEEIPTLLRSRKALVEHY